jgi:hypothetical protein
VQISCIITLTGQDVMAFSPDAAAMQILVAVGGNQTKDSCAVTINQQETGAAGTPPAPPEAAPSEASS